MDKALCFEVFALSQSKEAERKESQNSFRVVSISKHLQLQLEKLQRIQIGI